MIFGKHINKYYKKYGYMLVLGILALLMVDAGILKIPELYRMLINGINDGTVMYQGTAMPFDGHFLLQYICRPLILVALVVVIGRFFWRIMFFGASIKVETALRDEMFTHAELLSQNFYQTNKTGDLMSLFTNDIETVQDCFGSGILVFFDAVILGGLALFKMFRMDWQLTLLSMVPMAVFFLIGVQVNKLIEKRWDTRQTAFSKLSDFSQESFSGIAVIKAFAKETLELISFQKLNKENEEANVEYTKVSTLLEVLILLFVQTIICIILGCGGYLVYIDVFNAGQLIEFIGYFTEIIWPVEAIALLVDMSAKGNASLKRISELLDAEVDVCDGPDVKECPDIKGEIEFRNLSFTYEGSHRPVLKKMSFHIQAGENIGIIGKTGSGKTTMVDLIARIHNIPEGMLFIDGRDVNTIPIRDVRAAIAYVPQDNFLFSDSIAENIAFSNPVGQAASIKKVHIAAKQADIHDNIAEFPKGYDTVLGERGVTVSGGQKQRISIARALMKRASILILDDSVSAVDTKTEKRIIDALHESRTGMTTLMIAHRVSTVEQMDKILFVEDGRILDFGSHEELLKRCVPYAELVEMQRLEDSKEEEEQILADKEELLELDSLMIKYPPTPEEKAEMELEKAQAREAMQVNIDEIKDLNTENRRRKKLGQKPLTMEQYRIELEKAKKRAALQSMLFLDDEDEFTIRLSDEEMLKEARELLSEVDDK